MNILMASDHAGFDLKEFLKSSLGREITVTDLGTYDKDTVDYPDMTDNLCKKMLEEMAISKALHFGVLICGSGVGVCMRANRYPEIRAVQAWSLEIARTSREHNDANVICFGERVQTKEDCLNMLEVFLATQFLDKTVPGRHANRVKKLSNPVKL